MRDHMRQELTMAALTVEIQRSSRADLVNGLFKRILADTGYRAHNALGIYKLRVFSAGQKHRVTPAIKRQIKRRSAVEPVIDHLKNGHCVLRRYFPDS